MSIESSFPGNVLKYSALRYLQEMITEKCNALPQSFDSLDSWTEYRNNICLRLRAILPIWDTDPRESRTTASSNLGNSLFLESVEMHFDRDFYIPVHIYQDRNKYINSPAVLVCPGYGQAKNSEDIIDICSSLAHRGFVAMAMEYDATGERADRPDFETGINNVTSLGQLLGINNIGLRVMSNLAALRYLKSREDVDPNRIGITGLCQGAIVTWFTSALCEEFKAVAPLCGATTYEAIALEYANRQGGWSGTSPYVFNMLEFADFQHIAAVTAPRPLFVQNNLIDIHWPFSGFEKVKQMAAQVYGLYGADGNCRFSLENGPHAFAEPFLSNIADWFSEVL